MRKAFVFIVLAAVFVLAMIQDRQRTTSKTLYVQGIDSVVSAQLIPAHAGAGATAITLDATKAKDKEIISKVIGWLNSSKVIGDAKDQFFPIGGNPTSFSIGFISGESIRIVDAVGAVSRKLDNGSIEVHSGSIPNQVTVYQNNKARRIVAPELKAWIENGWMQEAINLEQDNGNKQPDLQSSCKEPPKTLEWAGKKYILKIIDTDRSLEPNMKLGYLTCSNGKYVFADDDGQNVITIHDAPATKDNSDINLITEWGRLLYVVE